MKYKTSKRPVHNCTASYIYTGYKSLKHLLSYHVVQWFALQHHLDLFGVQSFIL